MSKHGKSLKRLAPALAAQFEGLQDAIRSLGDEIGTALAAQAEQQKAERKPEPEPSKEPAPANLVDVPSATIGFRARQVAERLSIHQQTLWSWIRQGRFPPGIRIGAARVIWTEAMLAEFLDNQRANPGARRPLPRERIK